MRIRRALRDAVRARAEEICEYCRFPEAFAEFRFVIDHIIARQHKGPNTLDNLALCCPFCNYHKGPNLSGFDLKMRRMFRLFNPRTDAWADHFRWKKALIIPKTAIGRVTVEVLQMNHSHQIDLRLMLIFEGKTKLQ